MRSAEILVEMLLDEANPVDWAKQTWGNFKQSRLAQNMWLTKQPRKVVEPVTAPVTPAGKVTHIAIVYGPNLPQKGYYMTGAGIKPLLDKLKKAMSQKLGNRAVGTDYASVVNSWVVNGYQMFISDKNTGELSYFGTEAHPLDQATANILGAKPTTHMRYAARAGAAARKIYPTFV